MLNEELNESNFNEHSLAWELLKELKTSAKRWFVVSIIELGLILGMAVGFIWYISLPVEEYAVDQQAEDNSYNQIIGGDYNGERTKDNIQETQNDR